MVSAEHGELVAEIRQEFRQVCTSDRRRSFDDFSDKYEHRLDIVD